MALEKKFKILIYPGLHTRPGAKFVELCNKFDSDIEIFFNDKVANGKSIINIMTMAAPQNAEITVKVDGVEWIRLHYAFPNGFPVDVLEVINSEPKICNYIDIPLQHISNKILKSMKRGASMEKINDLLQMFRDKVPEIAIRTTLIVGYPGETNEDYELLKEWVKNTKFDRLGCFTYSHEENTGAYKLIDDVPQKIKNERLNEIMEIQSQISWELNQKKIGKKFKVLIDRKRGNYYVGRTQYDSPDVDNEVLIQADTNFLRVGEFVDVKIIEASDFDLYAEVS